MAKLKEKMAEKDGKSGSYNASTPPPAENGIPLPGEIPPPYESLIPQEGKEGQEFYQLERLIIRTVIRYGEQILCEVADENENPVPVSVIEYIVGDLKEDDLSFHNPLHRRILSEAAAHMHDKDFKSRRYFLAHPDQEISRLSAELLNNRYQLSKYHTKGQKLPTEEERLLEVVPNLMINFKNAIVEEELKHIMFALQNPENANNVDKCNELMERYKDMKQIQSVMAKRLGDRVVLVR